MEASLHKTVVRTALFVDFDQVFGGLHRERSDAAERFATQPEDWLSYLEEGQHDTQRDEAGGTRRRAILLRRCYMNPVGVIRSADTGGYRPGGGYRRSDDSFGKYRAYFTRSAFSVVDCPPLTNRGKNSADIVMVMDILDALEHKTHFDEFIILSGDADFAPVLLRLRAHDRRTAILGDLLTARAYRAASDILIRQADFIEHAIGLDPLPELAPGSDTPAVAEAPLIERVARAVADQVAKANEASGFPVGWLTQTVFGRFGEFRLGVNGQPWFGLGSLARLLEDIVRLEPSLRVDKSVADRWVLLTGTTSASAAAPEPDDPEQAALRANILASVREALAGAHMPMVLAHLAQDVMRRVPATSGGNWPGGVRFADLLRDAADPQIALQRRTPGYAFDPILHPDWIERDQEEQGTGAMPDEQRDFVGKVSKVSGCPPLPDTIYRSLFHELANEIDRLNAQPGHWTQSYLAIAVYERCAGQGLAVTREAIGFILGTIERAGHAFDASGSATSAEQLSGLFRDGVRDICEAAQLALSDHESRLLDLWLTGASPDRPAEDWQQAEPTSDDPVSVGPA